MIDRFAIRMACAWLFVLSTTVASFPEIAAAGGTIQAAAVEPTERVACSREGAQEPYLTWKRGLGRNRNRSIAEAAAYVSARITKVEGKIETLSSEPPSPAVLKRVARLTRVRSGLLELEDNLPDCASGALLEEAASPSFAFLCRFGFHAPSVATRRECSLNLDRQMTEGSAVLEPSTWNVDAVAGVLDELLADACGESGGVLLRNTTLGDDAPMYSAFCAHDGKPVRTHYSHNTEVLGMEEEPTGDCFAVQFVSANAEDPCGDYKRPPGGGGGGGTPPPPPTSGDCLIQRMEEEPTGCE